MEARGDRELSDRAPDERAGRELRQECVLADGQIGEQRLLHLGLVGGVGHRRGVVGVEVGGEFPGEPQRPARGVGAPGEEEQRVDPLTPPSPGGRDAQSALGPHDHEMVVVAVEERHGRGRRVDLGGLDPQ